MMNWLKQFRQARFAGAPYVAIATLDPEETIAAIMKITKAAVLSWDCVRGWLPKNNPAELLVSDLMDDDLPLTNPIEAIEALRKIVEKEKFVAIIQMADRVLMANPLDVGQSIRNLRGPLKANGPTLVLVGARVALIPELDGDFIVLRHDLPSEAEREKIVTSVVTDFTNALPGTRVCAEDIKKAVEATSGLTTFCVEQATAFALTREGLDHEILWSKKKAVVDNTAGLRLIDRNAGFAGIGGCEAIKRFAANYLRGPEPPEAVIWIDEIEKAFSGGKTDTSGVTQEMLGTMLTWTSEIDAKGLLFVGPPGAAKSAMAKAIGAEHNLLTVAFDLTAMKGSLVGESGANLRRALDVVEAISNKKPLLIATSNNLSELPPELLRRFKLGTFFFDLPTVDERERIWQIYAKKYELPAQELPPSLHEGWTGAEIERCCDLAYRLSISVKEAAEYIVPISLSAKETIDALRSAANGRYLSAARPGKYLAHAQVVEKAAGRRFGAE